MASLVTKSSVLPLLSEWESSVCWSLPGDTHGEVSRVEKGNMEIVGITTPASGTQAFASVTRVWALTTLSSVASQTDNISEEQRKEYATSATTLGREAEGLTTDTSSLGLRFKWRALYMQN